MRIRPPERGRRQRSGDGADGAILGRAQEILFANFLTFVGLAALPVVVQIAALVAVGIGGAFGVALVAPDQGQWMALLAGGALLLLLLVVVSVVAYLMCTATLINAAFQHMRGRPVLWREAVANGARRLPAMLSTTLCAGVPIVIGLFLLAVPGMILICGWYVALPVCQIERLGAIASLKRSWVLTKGHRWRIFGLLAALALIGAMINGMVTGIGAASHSQVLGTIPGMIFMVIWAAYQSVVLVVAYHDLRVLKDNIDIEGIAAEFD